MRLTNLVLSLTLNYPKSMANIQLKIVDEGLHADQHTFVSRLREALLEHDVYISDPADITLKIKFVVDDGHEKVLLLVRETETKQKISEDVILYFPDKWINKAVTDSVNMTLAALSPAMH